MSLSSQRLLLAWGEGQRKTLQELDPCQPAFYLSDFFLKESLPWIQYKYWQEVSSENLKAQLEFTMQLTTCQWTIAQPEQFRSAFEELKSLLQTDQLQKAVPYLFAKSSSQMTRERLCSCLRKALIFLEKKAGYLYGHWNAGQGILGITPELLFYHSQHQSQKIQTMALAGTCHTSHCQDSFLIDEKERHEHQVVVQGICQSLQAVGSIQVGTIQLLQLPHLTHLMTPIEVQLHQFFNFDSCVHCLHPTPALGASPWEDGKKWVEDYQKHTPRGYYGAPIGFKYPQEGLSICLVGIRNVQWEMSEMLIGAGCGVVNRVYLKKNGKKFNSKLEQFESNFIYDHFYSTFHGDCESCSDKTCTTSLTRNPIARCGRILLMSGFA